MNDTTKATDASASLAKTESFLQEKAGEIAGGGKMMKMQTAYTTAVSVQKPRDLDQVVANVLREAEYAGEDFYYSWGSGKNHVEGASVGLALSVVREWGNCAVETEVEETPTAYLFTGHYIDVEKGFTLSRTHRQSKSAIVYGKLDEERKADIRFQIGQSKAIRNVVNNAMPKWLIAQALQKAKDSVLAGISRMGIVAATEAAIKGFAGYGVTEEQIVKKAGKPKTQFTTRDIEELRTAYAAIKNGEAYTEQIFPPQKEASKESSIEKTKEPKKEKAKEVKAPASEKETGEVLL